MDTNKNHFHTQLENSLRHGFIDFQAYPEKIFAPKMLVNNPETKQIVLTDLQHALQTAEHFRFMTAFVTTAGIDVLKTQFSDFAKQGGHGQLLVSPYLGFNEPKALRELLKLPNVEVRFTPEHVHMHAKLYLFKEEEQETLIIGSSNLTLSAIKLNYEWNVRLTSTTSSDLIRQANELYNTIWNQSQELTEEGIERYALRRSAKPYLSLKSDTEVLPIQAEQVIQPNPMQAQALIALQKLRENGESRALVISATGTGKTYLAAFNTKNVNPKRMLFLVHREQILRQAQADFQKVLGFSPEETSIFRSRENIEKKRFVFATIQTVSRPYNLEHLDPYAFDYIIIDEAHRIGGETYSTVIEHFKPKYLLGLTATPERSDTFNVFEKFNYNVAYEIRLQQALEEKMLAPFLYFGVSDIFEEGIAIDDRYNFYNLTSDARVQHILDKISFYGLSDQATRGLIFCSRKDEARELSRKLNLAGLRTAVLTGEDSQDVRQQRILELESASIEYILTVDIFNEGVDIPSINQIIMLRGTESSIVFIQQLGRGLRKHPSKEYVTVIDFIGNYKNNYLIPIALYGDQSMRKEHYLKEMNPSHQIQGFTTVNFERIARERVFSAIDNTQFSQMKFLKEAYTQAKARLGHPPQLTDFLHMNSIDPILFFDSTSFKNKHYPAVVEKFEGLDQPLISNSYTNQILAFITSELLKGIRPHDLLLLKLLFTQGKVQKSDYLEMLNRERVYWNAWLIESVERILDFTFYKKQDQLKFGERFLQIENNQYAIPDVLLHPNNLNYFLDVIEAGLKRTQYYPASYTTETLEIEGLYTRKDACKLLWDAEDSSTIYGYQTRYGSTLIFVNYHKNDPDAIQYNDHFINPQRFHWFSRKDRTLMNKDVQDILQAKKHGRDIHLFIQKDNSKNKKTEFYYMGKVNYIEDTAKETTMLDKGIVRPVVTMDFHLETPVKPGLYDYLLQGG